MLKITDLKIDSSSLSAGKPMLLADITPAYVYENNERADKIEGYKYSVVLTAHKMEKISVKVLSKTPLIDTDKEEIPIGTPVEFTNLEVGCYYSKGQINVTAKADDVNFV